jgi:hypothetical protein
VATNGARAKARDTKRVADLKQIQKAVELYMNDNGIYPSCVGAGGGCYTTPETANFNTIQAEPTYISRVPDDPLNITSQYGYYYITRYRKTGDCTYVGTGLNTDYLMGTRLENPASVSGSCAGAINAWGNPNLNYILSPER